MKQLPLIRKHRRFQYTKTADSQACYPKNRTLISPPRSIRSPLSVATTKPPLRPMKQLPLIRKHRRFQYTKTADSQACYPKNRTLISPPRSIRSPLSVAATKPPLRPVNSFPTSESPPFSVYQNSRPTSLLSKKSYTYLSSAKYSLSTLCSHHQAALAPGKQLPLIRKHRSFQYTKSSISTASLLSKKSYTYFSSAKYSLSTLRSHHQAALAVKRHSSPTVANSAVGKLYLFANNA